MMKGLVLRVYSKDKEDDMPHFTSAGESFNKLVNGKLRDILNMSGPPLKTTKTNFPRVVLVGLSKRTAGVDEQENWHEGKENIRAAVTEGCGQVQDLELSSVEVDPCGDAQAAAEEAAPMQMKHPWCFLGSGGISIKTPANMDLMRADVGGAATICSAIVSAAKLNLPINIIGLAPLCENMPSGRANKPGDVVRAQNGKTIQVDNTDAEGRLILADVLCCAHTFNPKLIINAATLTGATDVVLGPGATGVFTNSFWLWNKLFEASIKQGTMSGGWLSEYYTRKVVDCQLADVNNVGKYRSAGACTAVKFLGEFVTHPKWAHLDIAGVMTNKDEVLSLCKGMTGRATRTLIEF
ncbi:Cytosol aminopeptidase [Heterocephalus glaber]|uniref:Cytosol aminopeptidase n=1 Tax=Heterocephalus glaber TaxID=10181 RepID=G5ANJ7_HETGA|nr:Cytosol aminopeptidase [Heterocephalus glaber]